MHSQISLKQLKYQVYQYYKVENSKQLKQVSPTAAKLDLRYKKNWYALIQRKKNRDNVVSLASHIINKVSSTDVIDSGLQSLSQDLSAFEQKIESDFKAKRKNSKKYRRSLTYL